MKSSNSKDFVLFVYITHFVPPHHSFADYFVDFFRGRFSRSYLRSWVRLLVYGHRGHQPWKRDKLTFVRKKRDHLRLKYLMDVILSLLQLDVKSLNIQIITNSISEAKSINALGMRNVKVHVFEEIKKMSSWNNSSSLQGNPESPWLLTWKHKEFLKLNVGEAENSSLFLYLENDELFSQSNLDYWLEASDQLNSLGLIPSFVRTEWDLKRKKSIPIDIFEEGFLNRRTLPTAETLMGDFVQLPNPYSGCYLMKTEEAKLHISSPAFSESESRSLTWWGIGERAAMGNQFISVPNGFTSRNVVLVSKDGRGVDPRAWVPHLTDFYAPLRTSPTGWAPWRIFENKLSDLSDSSDNQGYIS